MRPQGGQLARTNLWPRGMVQTDKRPMLSGELHGFGAGGLVRTLETYGVGRKPGTFDWDGAADTRAWADSTPRIRVSMMLNVGGGAGIGAEIDQAMAIAGR